MTSPSPKRARMATTELTPPRSLVVPKLYRTTDWTASAPHMETKIPTKAETQPRMGSPPTREPQSITPNRQKRKVSQLPNFSATAAMKGWMKNTRIMARMEPMQEET